MTIPDRKIMLLGEIGVGKTSLIDRFVNNSFQPEYRATIGVAPIPYLVSDAGPNRVLTIRLVLWDTDGNFREGVFDKPYMRGAAGAVVVGDAFRPRSLIVMADLAERFRLRFPGHPIVCMVNKIDLVARPDDIQRPERLADVDIKMHKTSAKTGLDVRSAFLDLTNAIIRRGI